MQLISQQLSSSLAINSIFKSTKCKYDADTLPINFKLLSPCSTEGEIKSLRGCYESFNSAPLFQADIL